MDGATAKDSRVTIRVPADLLAQLREQYAQTYPLHRMSWNTWLISRLRLSFGFAPPSSPSSKA
jgi:hypothetical protein